MIKRDPNQQEAHPFQACPEVVKGFETRKTFTLCSAKHERERIREREIWTGPDQLVRAHYPLISHAGCLAMDC